MFVNFKESAGSLKLYLNMFGLSAKYNDYHENTFYYKILNSKFKSTINADSELQAQIKLKESLIILKTTQEIEKDPNVERLKNILGMNKTSFKS